MIKNHFKTILGEIQSVVGKIKAAEVKELIKQIEAADRIVLVGAGRVGMACRGFAMRLGHFGYRAFMLGDATVPGIGKGDLLLVASGSGETQTIYDLVAIAKKNKATIGLITGNPLSRMGKKADFLIKLPAPNKLSKKPSQQPMTTLNEQCLGIFFDAVVLELMEKTGQTSAELWARHSNLE